MKKCLYLLIATLLFSCEKDDSLTTINNNGTGGISCVLNGDVLVPKGGWIYGNSGVLLDYIGNGISVFELGFKHDNQYINMYVYNVNALDANNLPQSIVGTYQFGEQSAASSYATYSFARSPTEIVSYSTTNNIVGEIDITFHDVQNHIFSGTFWFDAIDQTGKIVHIRRGRFDLK
jgi:hypothetical protein